MSEISGSVEMASERAAKRMTKCMYCEYRDGSIYTSNPPKYKCTITGEYHLALDDCNVEFAPVKHGRWIEDEYGFLICSACGNTAEYLPILGQIETPYCNECGARMDEAEE